MQHGSRRSPGRDPLADVCSALLALALHRQRPPAKGGAHGHPEGKALLGRERHGRVCLRVHRRHVSTQLIDEGRPPVCKRQTIGMRQRVRQGQGLVDAGSGLLWVPQ